MRASAGVAASRSRALATPIYHGRACIVATMHGKEKAIAPPFSETLGLSLSPAPRIDTDSFGTFSGEIERSGTALDCAVRKARRGMKLAGVDLGVASEGTYGPHPIYQIIPGGTELMTFIDDSLGVTVTETLIAERTNFSHRLAAPGDDLDGFLRSAGFPEHALIIRPATPAKGGAGIICKGIADKAALARALRECAALSGDRLALIETDMRAHLNPTRMGEIRKLAARLAARINSACPACSMPGFGETAIETGLPCELCGDESTLMRAVIFGCAVCAHREERPRRDGLEVASPTYCPTCNP